jgi:hypothetical protein
MLSQDKCLPIAYKCLSFTVLFVLEKYYGFNTVFIWHRETIITSRIANSFTQGSQDFPSDLRPRDGMHASSLLRMGVGYGREGQVPWYVLVDDATGVRKDASSLPSYPQGQSGSLSVCTLSWLAHLMQRSGVTLAQLC